MSTPKRMEADPFRGDDIARDMADYLTFLKHMRECFMSHYPDHRLVPVDGPHPSGMGQRIDLYNEGKFVCSLHVMTVDDIARNN